MNTSRISFINKRELPTREFHQALLAAIPGVRRLSYALTGTMADADDLLQATLERALIKWKMYETGTQIERWLYRICRNIWIDEMRSRRTSSNVISLDEKIRAQLQGDDTTTTLIALDELQQAMGSLSETQRAVLSLAGIDGFSYKEVAEILDLPIGTVMSRLARARKQLAQALNYC